MEQAKKACLPECGEGDPAVSEKSFDKALGDRIAYTCSIAPQLTHPPPNPTLQPKSVMIKKQILPLVLLLALTTSANAATMVDIGAAAPGSNLILSNPKVGSLPNTLWNAGLNRNEVQPFSAPGNSSNSYQLTSFIFLDPNVQTVHGSKGFTISLLDLGGSQLGTPTTSEFQNPLSTESGTTTAFTTAANDYISITLATPWTLTGGHYYGIALIWNNTTEAISLQQTTTVAGVGNLYTTIDNGSTFTSGNSAVFYLQGQTGSAQAQGVNNLINDWENPSEGSAFQNTNAGTQFAIVSGSNVGVTSGSCSLMVTWLTGSYSWPGISRTTGASDWSQYGGLIMDVTNSGTADAVLNVRLDSDSRSDGYNYCRNGSATVPAGTHGRYEVTFMTDDQFQALADSTSMQYIPAVPYSYIRMKSTGVSSGGTAFNPAHVTKFWIYAGATSPSTATTLYFDNVRLVPAESGVQKTVTVNSFEAADDIAALTCTGCTTSMSTTIGVTSGTASRQFTWLANSGVSWPGISMIPPSTAGSTPTSADWSNVNGLAFDLTNTGTNALTFNVRVDNSLTLYSSTTSRTGWVTIPANSSGSYILPLESAHPLGIPGYTDIRFTGSFDPQHVCRVLFFMNQNAPATDISYYVDNIRLYIDTTLNKVVDSYGQNRKPDWDGWPGQVHTNADIINQNSAEQAALAAQPHPPGLSVDTYGGWTGPGSPTLTSGSYFRVAQVPAGSGAYWLIDPAGHLFYSSGIVSISANNPTFVANSGTNYDPSVMFNWLPNTAPYNAFYGTATAYSGPIQSGTTYNFLGANLYTKYGTAWATSWQPTAVKRLWNWGFNTVGSWSDSSMWSSSLANRLPYVVTMGSIAGSPAVKSIPVSGTWGPIPDYFDPNFSTSCTNSFTGRISSAMKTDSWLIGYYIDNELSWCRGQQPQGAADHYAVPIAVLGLTSGTASNASPAKNYLISQLKTTYNNDIGALNTAWSSSAQTVNFTSWTDPALTGPCSTITLTANQLSDFSSFLTAFANQYFSTVKQALQNVDPNHLYMGCKFGGFANEVYNSAASYCNVLSWDIYAKDVNGSQWTFIDSLPVPSIIAEFQFSANDRGMWGLSLMPVADQTARAAAFDQYVTSVKLHPKFVGFEYYEYFDQPLTGTTWDGENYPVGFISITDTPYTEMVNQAQTTNTNLYNRYQP